MCNLQSMVRRIIRLIVLMAFAVSAMPGFAMETSYHMAHDPIAQPSLSLHAAAADPQHPNPNHRSQNGQSDVSSCDEALTGTQISSEDGDCVEDACECVLSGCPRAQIFTLDWAMVYAGPTTGVLFTVYNTDPEGALGALETPPPKA